MALLTISEASQAVVCHPNTIRNWIRSGILHSYRIHEGGTIYVKDFEVHRLADRMRKNPQIMADNELINNED